MADAATRRLRYRVAYRVLCEGVTREAVARALNVSPRTIYTWIQQVLEADELESPPRRSYRQVVSSRPGNPPEPGSSILKFSPKHEDILKRSA
jgi:transposase